MSKRWEFLKGIKLDALPSNFFFFFLVRNPFLLMRLMRQSCICVMEVLHERTHACAQHITIKTHSVLLDDPPKLTQRFRTI